MRFSYAREVYHFLSRSVLDTAARFLIYRKEGRAKREEREMAIEKPLDERTIEKINALAKIVSERGVEEESVARAREETNEMDFLFVRKDKIGFVYYEFLKGSFLRAKKNSLAKRKSSDGTTVAGGGDYDKKIKKNEDDSTSMRPMMKLQILDVAKKALETFYQKKEITKEEYKQVCKRTCEKVMLKEDVAEDEGAIKAWCNEHTKAKIRSLVLAFVEKTKGDRNK